ncbi:enoyl-CoA hydratase-related protein [Mesorhizobium sp. 1M-11]|uniref:enoyl-CoA hydratase-related protein n=1 Tax=Mesorhizobium sp. 1M-11 TaxID=1529006 RepID=UPI0006C73ED4|nr:enoyl-CoA hydratase-related protein [Mesorhizobium sp. 1M-11]
MENEPLIVKIANNVASVRINRPQKKNAITFVMWQALFSTFEALSADASVRVVTLSGAGADFSAGADIAEFDTLRDGDNARGYEAANSAAFAAIRNARVPVIAALHGVCFGGGFGLAAAADLRIATPDALFAVPAAKLGLAYPQDAMGDIVGAAGPQMARYLTFTGNRIDAEAALKAGFLLEIVAREELERRVAELAATIAANAPLSVRASKLAIHAELSGDAIDVEHARTAGDQTFASLDYTEGRAAFQARRKPEFIGQ